jgi:hypothetical protein
MITAHFKDKTIRVTGAVIFKERFYLMTAQPEPESLAADNLRRWQESGQPHLWVESHNGQWNHADWLALLDDLKRSEFWPMDPNTVGRLLEQMKSCLISRGPRHGFP